VSWEHVAALYKMQPRWTSPQFVVLFTIGNFADPITSRTPPLTYSWMARQAGMARSTAIAAANVVEQLGLVAREAVAGERANVFRALWTPIASERRARVTPTVREPDRESPAAGPFPPTTVREPDRESPAAGPSTEVRSTENGVRGAALPRAHHRRAAIRMTPGEHNEAVAERARRRCAR